VFEYVHPEDAPAVMEIFKNSIRTLSSGQAVFRYRHRDGEWRWLESSGKAFLAKNGEACGVVVSRDITERKKIEEELLRASKLESLGVLAGGIAHDFNNLLTAIIGNLSLAKTSSNPSAEVVKCMVEAEKASLRAKGLTQQLLAFAKGGAPVRKTTAINPVLREAAGFALPGSKVRCEFHLPDDLWMVEIDEGQISQVINNLVINAQQAMPEGGIISIRGENFTLDTEKAGEHVLFQQGRYLKISITDHGTGIKKEHLSRIFDPYFTTKQRGSGLGLATAYSIIKNHEGYITVTSELGVGTTFTLYLPASFKDLPSQPNQRERSLLGKGKILVMDDEESIRELLVQMLTYCGYEAIVAGDGETAILLYTEATRAGLPFHAVIMDLTIPGMMGGKEAVKLLLDIDPDAKAIVSSGYANDPVMAEFRKYGFRGVVAKPYQIEELSEVLQTVLEGKPR
jgi:signal transduction histidine kinase/CheY-like chemotaxis protein